MKRVWMITGILMATAGVSVAQSKKVQHTTKTSSSVKTDLVRLSTESANEARAGSVDASIINIPYVDALNALARGEEPEVKKAVLFGMPKGAYGFVNGKLRVFPQGTTSFGTQTGSGSVATGSSLGAMSGTGLVLGVNGKSPYAGTAMWGNSRGLTINAADVNSKRLQ